MVTTEGEFGGKGTNLVFSFFYGVRKKVSAGNWAEKEGDEIQKPQGRFSGNCR